MTEVVVNSDRSRVWRWGNVLAPIFVGGVIVGALGTSSPPGSHATAISLSVLVPLAIAGAYLPCVYWAIVTGTRRYELDEFSLRVVSRGRVIREIPRTEIVGFRMRGRVTGWSFLTSPATWLRWPRGVVTVPDDEAGRCTIELPELILWGESSARDAEDSIRAELRGRDT